MTSTLFSSDLLARLRRSLLVSGVLFLSTFAGMCDDDDDDDDGTGPSADCIDELDFSEAPFDESDVEPISVGDNESGSITTSDVEVDFEELGIFYYDFYVVAAESNELNVEVDPSGDLDSDVILLTETFGELEYANDGGPGVSETLSSDVIEGACYVIGVSTSEAEATGSYTLSVD